MKKNMPFAGAVITFMAVLAVSVLFVCSHAKERRDIAVEKAQYLSAVNVSELERSLSSYMQVMGRLMILTKWQRNYITAIKHFEAFSWLRAET